MEFRKVQIAGGAWKLFGQYDTGTVVYAFPNIAQNANPTVIDTLGTLFATSDGGSYDPANHDPF